MSLQSQLNSFVTRVAEMFQQIDSRTGPLARLDTNAKSDLVTAINELAARPSGGGASSSGVAYQHNQPSASNAWVVNHNFATRDVVVQVYQASGNYEQVTCDVSLPTTNTARLNFAAAPASNAYRVVVMG